MNTKDKILARDTAMVLADTIVDTLAKSLPGINIAWNLSKALYGTGMKLRQKRALEWVEMIRDNPTIFTEQVVSDEKFQDGFVYALEKYLTERNETKRKYFRNIFLGFTTTENKEKYHLEKLLHTLNQIDEDDINTFRQTDAERTDNNYQLDRTSNNAVFNLIHAGLFLNNTAPRLLGEVSPAPFINMSSFGKEFIKFLLENPE